MNAQLNRGSGRRWFGAAVVVFALLALAAVTVPLGARAATTGDNYEPNDTKGTAVPIMPSDYWDYTRATIDPAGDQDFYSFEAHAGDRAHLNLWLSSESTLIAGRLDLYGGTRCDRLLASDIPSQDRFADIQMILPGDGRYCVRVRSTNHPNNGGPDAQYELTFGLYDRFEPNDSPDTATPIAYGQTIDATMIPLHNADYFRFSGQAGDSVIVMVDMVGGYGPVLSLIGPDGVLEEVFTWGDASIRAVLPTDGAYYVLVGYEAFEGFVTDGPYSLTLDKGVIVSPVTGGKVGGLTFDNDDVLLYLELADRWQRFSDPDAAGIDGDISAFDSRGGYYALKYPHTLCILLHWDGTCHGGWQAIQPHDVLSPAWRSVEWLFDGSDVGLSTSGEKIDALAVAPDGRLLLSTVDSGNVPGVGPFRDEDVLAFTPTQWGPDTAGTWALYFDGSTIPGLAAEDVTGLDVGPEGVLYLSLLDGFVVGGVRCGPTCIIAVYPDGRVAKIWDGRDVDFRYKLDAFDFPGGAPLMQP